MTDLNIDYSTDFKVCTSDFCLQVAMATVNEFIELSKCF